MEGDDVDWLGIKLPSPESFELILTAWTTGRNLGFVKTGSEVCGWPEAAGLFLQ
jgi:hypothetical protein